VKILGIAPGIHDGGRLGRERNRAGAGAAGLDLLPDLIAYVWPGRGKVTAKLRKAIEAMVWEGSCRPDAAKSAGDYRIIRSARPSGSLT
jgi:hypothetical protein